MATKLKSTGFKGAYLRECYDVLSADPPVLRWRIRPATHFKGGKGKLTSEGACKRWNKSFAGQTIRANARGRLRVMLDGQVLDARTVIAEIGITPMVEQQVITQGSSYDRSAEAYEVAGSGPLAAVMQAAMAETGRSIEELRVMSLDANPYRLDVPAKRLEALWFASMVGQFVSAGKRIHVRGVFYACISAGDVVKPDGSAFENDAENEKFIAKASKAARWLGYVPFERLVDNKNDPPVVRLAPTTKTPTAHVWAHGLKIEELDADEIDVWTGLAFFVERQPYRLVFFGEKTSLEDVLAPLAEEFSADLYLMSGHISDTHLHQMAKDAVEDGRPLVVITFSDFDPAGYWDMPTVIAHKLRALRDLLFPTLKFKVVHAALGPEQVRKLNLPSSPLKEGEKRAEKWLELYDSEQTEIDALATLQPAVLERIAREAVKPYFDAGLAERVRAAKAVWQGIADAEVAEQIDGEALDALKARARAALDELREVNAALEDMADKIEVSEPPPDLPEPDMDALEEAQETRSEAVLVDSDMTFAESVDRLHEHSEMVARRKPK